MADTIYLKICRERPDIAKKYGAALRKGFLEHFFDKDWKYTLVGQWLTTEPYETRNLERLRDACGGRYPTYEILTEEVLVRFMEILEENVSISSLAAYSQKLKGILERRMTKYNVPCPEKRITQILRRRPGKQAARQSVYLTMEEVERLDAYEPENDAERYVKKCFMIGCYTGARKSDAVLLDETNVSDGVLAFATIKTKSEVVMDVHYNLMKYLTMDAPKPLQMSKPTFNNVIKNMCRKCGICETVTIIHRSKKITAPKYQFVSSHTARRTFATNLYLNDVQTDEIASYMGHTSTNTTRNYIRCKPKRSAAALAFFHNV